MYRSSFRVLVVPQVFLYQCPDNILDAVRVYVRGKGFPAKLACADFVPKLLEKNDLKAKE